MLIELIPVKTDQKSGLLLTRLMETNVHSRKTDMKTKMIIVMILLSQLGVTHAQPEQWLTYRSSRDSESQGAVRRISLGGKGSQEDVPGLRNKAQAFKWKTPMAESGFIWIALNQSSRNGPFDRLVLDADCDGRLTGEIVHKAYRTEGGEAVFGPIKILFKGEDGPVAYHLNLRAYGQDTCALTVWPAGWYEGTVSLGDTTYQCKLLDYNANGAFNDRDIDLAEADRISLASGDQTEFRVLGQYFDVNKTLYALNVAKDGAFVTAELAQAVTLGQVKVADAITELSVAGPLGQFIRTPKNGVVELPVGPYCIDRWRVDRKDKDKVTWRLEGSGFGEQGRFEVTSDEPVVLDIGEPVLSILVASSQDDQYTLRQSQSGRLGETVTITRNGARPTAPKLNVTNKSGTYNKTFAFEYG